MKTLPGTPVLTLEPRIERGPDRRYTSHLQRYLGLALILGMVGLSLEYQINDTMLLMPAYRWRTREIPGLVLSAPDGAYSLSFQGTQLDWRLLRTGPGGEWPDFELMGYPDIRLTVYRRLDPGLDLQTKPGLLEEIQAPNAYSGRLVVTTQHHILGAFPAKEGFVLLRFESVPRPQGPAADSNTVINDIRRIAASFRSSRGP